MSNHPSEALEFHQMANAFLASAGLVLINNPAEWIGRFAWSGARYRSNNGLYLLVGFEPVDGNYAEVFFGREWQLEGRFLCLSNSYTRIASRFGYVLPTSYHPILGDGLKSACDSILSDLKITLPVILQRVKLEDLLAVENEQHGAAAKAKGFDVRISEFLKL